MSQNRCLQDHGFRISGPARLARMTARLRGGILATGGIARLFTDDLLRNGFG